MATAKFYNRDGVSKSLPLGTFAEIHYADFHIRSETTYPDVTITTADMPFMTLTKRSGTVVSLSTVLELTIITPPDLENDSDDVQTIDGVKVTQAVVTPSRNKGDDLRYDWNSKINFTNNVSSTTRVDLISGSLPDGLTLETGLIDNEYISLSGNIEGDLFGIDLTQYENLYKEWYSKQQTSFETIEYIDNLTDKNILSNPPLTFSIGDTITNVDEGSRDIRTINSVYTYDTTKTAVDVDTFVPVVNNYTGTYVTTYDAFNVQQAQKFDIYGRAEVLEPNWRGYISNTEGTIFAQYTNVNYKNTQMDLYYKDYTFTIGLTNPDNNDLLVEVERYNKNIR